MDILDYVKGDIPVASGTATALATLFEQNSGNYVLKSEHKTHDVLCISLHTLVRNIQSCLSPSSAETVKPKTMADSLADDVTLIDSLCKEAGLPVIFYGLSRKSFDKRFPIANRIIPKTTRQIFAQEMADEAIEIWSKGDMKSPSAVFGDMSFNFNGDDVVFITSNPVDLITLGDGKQKTCLLKSNTGEILPKADYAKLLSRRAAHKNNPAMDRIRFNALTLQIFGDGKLISAKPASVQDEILACAEKHDWTTATTSARIRMTMELEGIWKEQYDEIKF